MLDGDKIDQKHIYTCVCIYIYVFHYCMHYIYYICIIYIYVLYTLNVFHIYMFLVNFISINHLYIYIYHYLIVMKSVPITQHVSTENIICANKNCMTLSLIHMNILLEIIVPMIIMIHSNKSMNLQIQLAYFLVDSV